MTLLTLVFIVLFIFLGRWQLHRYAEKRLLQTTFTLRLSAPLRHLQDIKSVNQDILYYPLQVSGYFDNRYQLLLDNKMHGSDVGYEVVTLFIPDHEQAALLINRGWVKANANRNILPEIKPIYTHLTLQGHIALPPRRYFTLGSTIEHPGVWPARVEAIDMTQLASLTHHPLFPYLLLLNANSPSGYTREWHAINTDPYRSLGYAFQWFSFALTLLILYIALNFKRTKL